MDAKRRRILVAVDESETSFYALEWALSNLRIHSNDTLILCHSRRLSSSFDPIVGPGFAVTSDFMTTMDKYLDKVATQVITRALQACSTTTAKVEELVVTGDAREAICKAAKDNGVDFLVMGSHGYGALKRTVLGSVSDYCAHHAKCPVMIVKRPRSKAPKEKAKASNA